jgi:hypothetical protein
MGTIAAFAAVSRSSDSPGTTTSESPAIHRPSGRFGVNRACLGGVTDGLTGVVTPGDGAATWVSMSSSLERPRAAFSARRGRSRYSVRLTVSSGPVTSRARSRFQPSG